LTGLLINIRITGSFLSWPLIDSIKNTVPFKLVFHLSNWKYSNYSGRGVGGGCFRVATPNVDDIVKVTIGAIASLCEIGAASATSTLSSFVSRRFFCVRQYRVWLRKIKVHRDLPNREIRSSWAQDYPIAFQASSFLHVPKCFFQSPHNTVRVWHAYGER
jgi:hypothetical protein